jgi:hypothetical protein
VIKCTVDEYNTLKVVYASTVSLKYSINHVVDRCIDMGFIVLCMEHRQRKQYNSRGPKDFHTGK